MPGLVQQNTDAGVGVGEGHQSLLSTAIDIIDDDGNQIGFITQFTDNDNRPVTAIKHINSDDAGRTVENAPGPATRNLNVTGYALFNKQNNGSVIQRIGGSTTRKKMKTLEEQKIPFNIVEREAHPETGDEEITTHHQCWLTSHSKPINIGTVTISETCAIQVTWTD